MSGGVTDVLVSNEVVAPSKIARLVALAKQGKHAITQGLITFNGRVRTMQLLKRSPRTSVFFCSGCVGVAVAAFEDN